MVGPETLDSLTYRFAAAIICVTCLFYSTAMRKGYRIRSRLFNMLVSITLIDSLTDVVSYFIVRMPVIDTIKWIVTYLMEVVYYFTHLAVMPVFAFYIMTLCGVGYKFKKIHKNILKFPLYLLEITLLTNPITSVFFVTVGEFDYARGPGIYVAYAISGAYLVFAVILLIRYWYTINRMKQIAMIYFLALATGGTAIQMLVPGIKCELLCEAIGLSGIMIMIEKDDDRTDAQSKAYNRTAFVQDVKALLNLRRDFKVFCLRFENLDIYRKVYGIETINRFMVQAASYFMDDGTETDAYHTAFEVFYVIETDKTEEEIAKLGEQISDHFNNKFDIRGNELLLDTRLLIASCPDQLSTINDIFLLETAELGKNDKKVLKGSDLNFLLRRIEVEKAIGRGLSEKKFSIYYYPAYTKEDYAIKIAQVWLKLSDTIIGDIKTEEFMEVAVNSGFIEEIQIRIVEGICRFLSNGVDKTDMQLDFILVPILSPELINKEVWSKIRDLIMHYKIDPSLIAFVFKESFALYARESLYKLQRDVEKLGVRLYVSDYQAGFLGIDTISSIVFEGVILDIKNLFESDDAQNADIVLANRTNMIRQLGKKIIIAGVNSKEYYDKIKTVEFDYVQGSFFSEEVSKNELQNKFWHGEHIEVTENGPIKMYDED